MNSYKQIMDPTSSLFLVYPKKGKQKELRDEIVKNPSVRAFVNHGPYFKVWADKKPKFKFSKNLLEIRDYTTHTDSRLLEISLEILRRKHSPERAISILTHYLFNMDFKGYEDEEKYVKNRLKAFKAFKKTNYTAEEDHGWEWELTKAQSNRKRARRI